MIKENYITKKGFDLKKVKPLLTGIDILESGTISIPLYTLSSLTKPIGYQTISPSGDKKFTKGVRMKGSFYTFGGLDFKTSPSPHVNIYLCEGFATGLTIHSISKSPVIVVFNCSNLTQVLKTFYEADTLKLYEPNFVIAADNDHLKSENSGLTTAKQCASKYSIPYCYPKFDEEEPLSDFNDLCVKSGLETTLSDLYLLYGLPHDTSNVSKLLNLLPQEYYDTYDKWLYVGMSLHNHFKGSNEGYELYNAFSQKSARYDPQIMQTKWDSFGGRTSEQSSLTLEYIKEAIGLSDIPLIEPYKEKEKVSKTHYLLPTNAQIMKELPDWIFVYARGVFFNMRDRRIIHKKNAKDYFINFCKKGDPIIRLLKMPDLQKVYDFGYCPKEKNLFKNDEKTPVLNLWKDPSISPKEGDVTPFTEHLEYLAGRDWEKLRDFLSWCVQYPDKKLGYMLLLIGPQGIGKGYLETLLRKLFHTSNVCSITDSVLRDKYTGWSNNNHFIIINELMGNPKERFSFYNSLKTYITEDIVPVREMHTDLRNIRNYLNFLAFSNYDNCIVPDSDDRRLAIIKCHNPRKEHEYYKKLREWTASNTPHILYYLQQIEVGRLTVGLAPSTAQKNILMRDMQNKGIVEELTEILIEKNITVFSLREAVTFLNGEMDDEFNHMYFGRTLSIAFQNLTRIRINGVRERLYCLHAKADEYIAFSIDEIRDIYDKERGHNKTHLEMV